MDPDALTDGSQSLHPGDMRLRPDACSGIDTSPEYDRIGVATLADFLKRQGYGLESTRARDDLTYLDVTLRDSSKMRLRVAVLDSPAAAARDLHEAILEHGRGSWGVRRSNVAVLAPIGSVAEVVTVATETRLACWGVLTLAGRDDLFVVPGGYFEL